MPEHEKPTTKREWQEIARDASKETNPEKLKMLTDELSESMESRRDYFDHEQSSERKRSARASRPL
jgi:hypothetical protein